jgi:hypothetical protein
MDFFISPRRPAATRHTYGRGAKFGKRNLCNDITLPNGAMIQQRNVGRSGLRVSSIGLGCNHFGRTLDLAASRPIIHAPAGGGQRHQTGVYARRCGAHVRRSFGNISLQFCTALDRAAHQAIGNAARGHGASLLCAPYSRRHPSHRSTPLDDSLPEADNLLSCPCKKQRRAEPASVTVHWRPGGP